MTEAEVREALGEPTETRDDVSDDPIYAPRDADCKAAAHRCLVYESWSGHAVLVYFGSEEAVVCVEKTTLFRSH